ncbi:Zinc finger CCHC-type superfamily [Arabidopsis suecica]|uniref:Zinc finger CCHC-type superfamily n=1 Tax=Arabidopsis suecica TaxID=45249 RepID=A0A8T1ZWS9_ARASU|nr:Zinc finger CCHC-type superfamily [Arabidopsis suecica]
MIKGEVQVIVLEIVQDVRQSLKSRLMEILRLPFKKRFSWNEGNKSLHGFKADGNREELGNSSKSIQCFECKGFGHVRYECANLLKQEKKIFIMSNSEIDSDDGEELKNFVAFTNFESSSAAKSTSRSSSASASRSTSASATGAAIGNVNDQSDDDENISDEEFAENYKALYDHWLRIVEENSVLTKEKLKLEAKVIEAQKYAVEKEEEAAQAKVQLEETQKNLRMLNNGTKKLDHILIIGKNDKCGLGFKGKLSKSDLISSIFWDRAELQHLELTCSGYPSNQLGTALSVSSGTLPASSGTRARPLWVSELVLAGYPSPSSLDTRARPRWVPEPVLAGYPSPSSLGTRARPRWVPEPVLAGYPSPSSLGTRARPLKVPSRCLGSGCVSHRHSPRAEYARQPPSYPRSHQLPEART